MDTQTKKLIGNVLVLLGMAAIGVILYDYLLVARKYGFPVPDKVGIGIDPWRWSQGEVFQIIAGMVAIGTGFSLRKQASS